MIDITDDDLKRLESLITSKRDKIYFIVLQAIGNHLKDLKISYGNIPVVRDYSSDDLSRFFVVEVRENKIDGICRHLRTLIENEPNPEVSRAIKEMINPKNQAYALEKRVYRYLKEMLKKLRKKNNQ
jgi:hypothetical protein